MNEGDFKMTPLEKKVMYEPRTGREMQVATHGAPILKYSELCEMSRKHGPVALLSNMFKRSLKNVILLQDPLDMNSGHWIAVEQVPSKKRIYFFSTYGGRPDEEKMIWMNEDEMYFSGQRPNIFSDGLRAAQKHGWEIHYNDYPFQREGDRTAMCGVYAAAFLNSGKTPEEFRDLCLDLEKRGENPAVYFYKRYFF